ncbi:hypothetical protein TanjilG_15720 [Lupinus angustifolius]|uniref:Uncharacterized protein n=1 Tax=Lupinus angustifolius TaxID=3871 RepID=A0A1J7HNG6_LUPAN|nr:hypothetical protein TanjilG_15720 [Lupinus angustifolius]
MEKGKSRTDLLAAGRKKLQQFRQKKDNKGGSSRGKSSNKYSKHQQLESDADAASSNPTPVESSQVTDGNAETDSNVVITESLESQSGTNSLAPDDIDPSVDSLSVAITYDSSSVIGVETEVDSNSKLALQQVQGENDSELSVKDQGESARDTGPYVETEVDSSSKLALQQVQGDNDSDLSVKDQGESATNTGPYVAQDIFLSTSDSLRFEGGATNDHVSAPVDILSPSVSFEDAVGDSVPVEREGEKKEESLLLSEDIPNTSEGRSGAMQEADGLDMMKSDQITDAMSDGEKKISLFEVGDGEQLKQLGKSVDTFSSLRDTASDNLSGSDKEQEDGIAITGPSMSNLARGTLPDSYFEAMPPHSGQEQIIEGLGSRQDRELQEELKQHSAPVESEVVDKTHELSKRAHEIDPARPLDVSPIFDASSVNLSQLAVIIRGLKEEDYHFLLKSRGAVSDPGPLLSSSIIQDNAISEAFERLKEELFLANLMKNIFNLQLAEQLEQQVESDNQHYQLVDKLSQLQASHNEVNEKNQHLNEELENCRVELQDVSSRSVEMQNQFNIADANMEALSSRVVELQLCFEMAQKESLDLSTELADCRGLISGLQEENRGMNEVNEKNKQLNEELEKCRVELHNVSSRSVEMQNQFNIAEANVEALSARVIDLQICFEMSQKESLDLSTELVDCRVLISGLQEENEGFDETLGLMITEKNKLLEEKEFHLHESKKLATELADFKSLVETLKAENSNLIDQISLVTEDKNTIKAEIEHLTNEVDRISLDLVENKNMVASLQEENSNLCGNLALSADKIKNLEEENEPVVLENQRLSSQLDELQEELALEKGERMRFDTNLKEATGHLEQLTKENVLLTSTLDEHKAKIEEISKKPFQPLFQHAYRGNQAHLSRTKSEGLKIAIAEDSLHMDQNPEDDSSGGPPQNLLEHEVFDETLGFVSLNTCLNEVEQVLSKLEKSVTVLHSRSGSFGRSSEKLSSPRISRLIQAFESKSPEDEHEVEGKDSSAVQSPSDSLMLTKDQIGHLRKLLTKWKLDVQNACTLFKGERDGRKNDDAKYNNLRRQFEELQQYCSNVEASNIELAVQCEAAKQLLGDIEEKKCHLDELCKSLKEEGIHLKTKNYELYEKIGHCHSKISELRTEMYGVKQSSNEMFSSIGSQLENMKKEVTERSILGQGWNTIAEIVELISKLNESVGKTLSSISDSDDHDSMDISHRLAVSVNAVTELIFDLQKKLDATYSELEITSTAHKEVNLKCDDLLGRNELAVGVLHKMYNDLRELVHGHGGFIGEGKIDGQIEALPDLLNFNNYQVIMDHLGDILNKKLELESVTKEMRSELMQREIELEEFKMKCLGLDSVSKLIEDVAAVLNVETSMVEINKSPLSCLETLVSSLLQKNRETEIQLHMTKEGYGSKEIELSELKENIHSLDNLRLENENEILVLKENLQQAEEALSATRSELHEKKHELENSEQRVSSIREKLGIAVSKGKGLVVQRDGLKQSLAETSSELERCLQELQLKDTRLHEVETKLKTYAEAGERVDALESELSYIRNSANALRESFLLKDSVLQRIEEVLEDLDLPEQFHSRDIIEKIDWLARSVAANSLSMNEWGQKDSAGGGSYSDGGYVVTDSWKKDDSPLQPDSGDDFRKTFEEVQTKYYVLAEQNEMLEQSLMERNSLVQRWEGLVDSIDMPSHLQSMEMEDRIEWVGRALAEANHHVDSLQLEIEKYESYCGLLNADLEESQRRLSAVQADLKALASEREHLSEKMEALILENEKLSSQTKQTELENEKLHNEITSLTDELEQKAAHDSEKMEAWILEHEKLSSQTKQTELENEKLHNEITSLKDELDLKTAHEEQVFTINGKIRKLQDLVSDALSESETEDLDSVAPNIDSLEELLRKLIANHASFSSTKPPVGVPLDGHHLQKDVDTLHEARSIDLYDREEANVDSHKKDLEEALSELVHVKEERDKILEKQTSLSGEVEVLSKRCDELQELLDRGEANFDRYKNDLEQALSELVHVKEERDRTLREQTSLSGEFEALHKRNDELQELLNQAEANVDRYKKDLEVALSELVHVKEERERTLEKQTSLSADVDSYKNDLEQALRELVHVKEERDRTLREQTSLSGEFEALCKRNDELQELLNQAEANVDRYKKDLEVALSELVLVKEERDRTLEKQTSLSADVDSYKNDLEQALRELVHVKEERDRTLREQTSLSGELEALHKRNDELQELLSQAEANVNRYKKDLEVALSELAHVKEERDRTLEKQTSLSVNVDRYKNDLEQALRELVHMKEERDRILREQPSISGEFEALHKRNDELQELFNQAEANVDRYKKDLEVALSELVHVKEERDRTLEKQTSLSADVDTLSKRNEELQQLRNQEEQKTASVREKLNVAVRKGKSVVQQRDSLKQTIEGMSIEMEHLKSEILNREHILEEHARKLTELLTYPGRLEALESESLLLKSHLATAEHNLKEQENYLELILNKLGEIEFDGEGHISDPVKKLDWIGKRCSDLRGAVVSSEQESRKSKRAAELLLAELNEVQDRNDAFQEELTNVAAELNDLRKERDSAEAAKLEALSHLEKLSALHEEGKSHFSEIIGLKSSMSQFCKGFGEVQNLMADAFSMDLESFRNLETGLESCMKGNNAGSVVDSSLKKGYDGLLNKSSDYKKSLGSTDSWSDFGVDHYDDNALIDFFHLLGHQLQEFLVEIPSLKERINVHSNLAQEQDKTLSKLMASIQREMISQRESWESMKKEIRERDGQLVALHRNVGYLYEACINSVNVIENGKAGLVGNKVESSDLGVNLKIPSFDDVMFEECIKTVGDRLSLAAKEFASIKTEFFDANQKEMKATITNLQRELQEKDVQRDRICSDLVKQIKDAEAAANSYSRDLQSVRIQEHNLKKQVDVVEAEKKKLEQRLNEQQDMQGIAAELEEKIRSQTDLLAAKDQEIEALMHAIDEEEVQMEDSTKKIAELEKVVQQKSQEIENLESSRGKVMKKLSITVNKFDELHHLSASLLSEVEKLQSQLQERDAEISFLRQEVTRCTNDVLHASQMSNQRNSDELFEFLMWIDMIVSQEGMHDMHPDMKSNSQVHEYKEILHRKLMSLLSELENLRTVTENKDTLLQVEKSKLEESNHKVETLERSLREKELHLNLLEGVEEPGKEASTSSEIVEVEPVTNEWSARGTFVAPQVRSLRKGNTEHVAIAVDEDPGSTSRIEDEEDDKVHGFKSLTSSKVVPRFTRPLTDLIDGLWVSCDRTLMRQPVLRLGIILYWFIMHAILAFVVV